MTTSEGVLTLLKTNSSGISGEKIASVLNVSRNAVWKAIEELRVKGYIIEAASGRGYKLTACRFMNLGTLQECFPKGVDITFYDSVDSTNDRAKQSAEKGCAEGSVFIAETQTRGKGRIGKSFYSPEGSGIYMSIVLRPKMPAAEALKITTCAAVAVSEAIESVTDQKVGIKWVNDLFIGKKKICGILTEASFNMENGGLDYAVLGIGVDVFSPRDGFGELDSIAGAIFPFTENTGELRCRLAAEIYERFFDLYAYMGNDELFEKYRRRLFIIGRRISVLRSGSVKPAVVLGIEKNYNLIVRYENGEVESLSSGEISIIPE